MKKKRNLQNESPLKPKGYPGLLRIVFRYLAQYKLSILGTMLCAGVTGAAVAIMPHCIKFIVDDCITPALQIGASDADKQGFLQLAALVCLLYIAMALIRQWSWRLGLVFLTRTLEGIIIRLRSEFFLHIQHLCMRFYDKNPSGELYNSIMGSPMANVKTFLYQLIMDIPLQAVTFIISISALIYYDAYLTLLMVATAAVMVLFNQLSRRRIRALTRDYLRAESEASKYINDMLHGMDAVKLYAIEDTTAASFEHHLKEMKDKGVRQTFALNYEKMKPELAQFVGTALVYLVGAVFCVYRGLSIGTLYAFISCMGIILSTLNSWLGVILQYNAADVGMRRIYSVMAEVTTTPELDDARIHSIDTERAASRNAGKPCITFENVRFAYDQKDIFRNFNCQIAFGESVALVGGSGSGKSTLTKLILRLYEVDEGHVTLFGRDVRDYHLKDLRRTFGIVPQNPFIFHGTIWDNIRIARPEATNYDIINAMEIAHVHEFVNDLPMGWSTVIGDGALSLSGGQRQRIAIARAVLKNPDILIFDEATSALDNLSERHIQAAMENLMKTHTVIIIAHRLSTVRNVDRILVFDRGDIVEEGSYDTLATGFGKFRELLDGTKAEEEQVASID